MFLTKESGKKEKWKVSASSSCHRVKHTGVILYKVSLKDSGLENGWMATISKDNSLMAFSKAKEHLSVKRDSGPTLASGNKAKWMGKVFANGKIGLSIRVHGATVWKRVPASWATLMAQSTLATLQTIIPTEEVRKFLSTVVFIRGSSLMANSMG